ncbi:MAG: cysteine desulfurase / selenocysteine lyase, partial [Candidatus Dependentiae bacterium]|nr:cysteine desulfurase / selenocysteine lyase [Candidatus Dependentiae bacterium]
YVLPIDSETYCVDISALDHLLTKSIKVFAATTSSNVLGPVWGVGDVLLHRAIAKVRALGVGVVLDVAQTIAHQPINVEKLDCDFLAFSVHKMGGPTGLGILYAHKRMHDQMKPYRFGGGMVAAVTSEFMTWQAAPHCYEAGTPPIAQVVGLGALLKFYKEQVDFPELKETEAAFCSQLICGLKNIPGLHIVGNADLLSREGHVVSFYLDDIHAHDLASSLGQYGCAVRAGDHCAQPLSALWDKKATVRVSFFMYNSSAQVQYLICAIERCVAQWRKLL